MTDKELAKFDGKNGQAAYIAVNGIVYDVTSSSWWKEAVREKGYQAGTDLTKILATIPHAKADIESLPVVDRLKAEAKKSLEIAGIPLLSIIIMAFVFFLMIATYMH